MPPEPEGPRRSRSSIAPWIVAAALALGIVLTTLFRGDAEWLRLEAEVDAAIARAREQVEGDRPPVFGEGVGGDAWPIYVSARSGADIDRLALLAEGSAAEPAACAEVVADHESVVGSLVDGARRTHVRRPLRWDPDEPLQVLDAMALGDLLIEAARAADGDGDPERAVVRGAAALRFARDLAVGGTLVEHLGGSVSAQRALAALGELVGAIRLERATLERLDSFLAEVDDSWPTLASALRRETAGFGAYVRDTARDGDLIAELGIGRLTTWRYLFSDRRLALAWWDHRRTQQELVDSTSALPWTAARAALEDAPRPVRSDPLSVMAIPLGQWAGQSRDIRARIRIVRAAIGFLATGDAGALEDPLSTGPLRTAATAAGVRIWSVGTDGVDDGGMGSFAPDAAPDIVFEVRS